MADLGDRIGGALFDPGPVPSGSGLVGYAGGRRALVESLSGMDGPPSRRAYGGETADWRAANNRWRSASRRAQRLDESGKAGKQRRNTPAERLTPAQRGRLEERAAEAKIEDITRRGMRARLKVMMKVDSPNARGGGEPARIRTLPSGGPGVLIDAETTREILQDANERGDDVAADAFLPAFWIAYGGGLDDLEVEIEEVYWLKLWPNGTPEPPDPS